MQWIARRENSIESQSYSSKKIIIIHCSPKNFLEIQEKELTMAKSQYEHDAQLEAEAKRMGDYELKPVVTKIHQKVGLFNLIRNARNKRQVDIEKAGE